MIKEVENLTTNDSQTEDVAGDYIEFGISLPLQMLFDDFMTFVSKTDFET